MDQAHERANLGCCVCLVPVWCPCVWKLGAGPGGVPEAWETTGFASATASLNVRAASGFQGVMVSLASGQGVRVCHAVRWSMPSLPTYCNNQANVCGKKVGTQTNSQVRSGFYEHPPGASFLHLGSQMLTLVCFPREARWIPQFANMAGPNTTPIKVPVPTKHPNCTFDT